MSNNDFEAWKDEYVPIYNDRYCSCSVRFGDLLPIMMEKMDVFEATDCYTYLSPSEFVAYYASGYTNWGYGEFRPALGY